MKTCKYFLHIFSSSCLHRNGYNKSSCLCMEESQKFSRCSFCIITTWYENCPKSNVSYFWMLVHDLRGRYWWYSNSGWTLPAIFHSMLLLWQIAAEGHSNNMASDMGLHTKPKCVTKFLHGEKHGTHWHSSTELSWRLNSGCEHNEVLVVHFSRIINGLYLSQLIFHMERFIFQWKQSRCKY